MPFTHFAPDIRKSNLIVNTGRRHSGEIRSTSQ